MRAPPRQRWPTDDGNDTFANPVVYASLPYRTFELIMQHISAIGVLASGAGQSALGTLLEADGRPLGSV